MSLRDTFRQLAKCVLIRYCEWNGVKIQIDYKPSWFLVLRRIYNYDLAHLKVRTIDPDQDRAKVKEYPPLIIETTWDAAYVQASEDLALTFAFGSPATIRKSYLKVRKAEKNPDKGWPYKVLTNATMKALGLNY